jgi:hypothetical protein
MTDDQLKQLGETSDRIAVLAREALAADGQEYVRLTNEIKIAELVRLLANIAEAT